MDIADIDPVLKTMCDENEDILLTMLVSNDGLPLCYVGTSGDFDTTGALYIELKLTCDQVLSGLAIGALEHIFVRARHGCVDIFPVGEIGLLACMTKPSANIKKLQMTAWRAVSLLLK